MVRLVKPQAQMRVYDPCVGSGGMLIQAYQYIEEHGGNPRDLGLYGQDNNGSVWSICKMNLLLMVFGPPIFGMRIPCKSRSRWASCSKNGQLNFHWRTVCLPSRLIEYVVLHELVHLCEPHHSPEFWQRLEKAMPDFEERKRWLAMYGREF